MKDEALKNKPVDPSRLAVSIVVRNGTRFLLVERAYNPDKGAFAFPGGKVEIGEALEDAIKRELFEETALTLHNASLLEIVTIETKSGSFLLHVFFCHNFSGDPKAGDDAASVGWYLPEEMEGLNMPQSVHDIIAKILASHDIHTS